MAEKRFNVIFSGKLVEGRKPPEVLHKLGPVLGLADAQVRDLFKAGAGSVILKELDGNKAYAMRDQLQEAGVICTLQEIETPQAASTSFADMQSITAPRPESRQRPQDLKPVWSVPVAPQQGPGIVSLVFKIVLLVALAGGGWWIYQSWFAPPTPAFTAYAVFAEAMARGQYQRAYDDSRGSAREFADSWVQMTKPTTMKVYGKEFSMSPPSVSSIAGDIAWIKRKKKLEKKKSDSAVELQVEQTVCRIPPGVSSALCKWPVTFQHDVELELVDGAWKVSGFKETRLTPQDK